MNLYGIKNQFRFHLDHEGNDMGCLGSLEWDKVKRQVKATIIAQKHPEIRFEAWDDSSSIAALLCIAKWSGRRLIAEPLFIDEQEEQR